MLNNKLNPFKYLPYLQDANLVGKEGYPQLAPTNSVPEKVISFNEWRANKHPEKYWVDHFIDDFRFECVYNNLFRYIERYKKAKGVIGTDYSAYRDMPTWQRKMNVGKNRTIDFILQLNGIDVIPVVSFAYLNDFDWCLDGLPRNSSVAISTNGSVRNIVSKNIFIDGVFELQKRLKPSALIIAGGPVSELDDVFDNIYYYPIYSQRLLSRRKNNG